MALDVKGNHLRLESEYCLTAVGRRPCTSGLGLDTLGMELNPNGSIKTDPNLQTSINTIYAIGDVTGGMMLAHKASEEGIFVAELLSGRQPKIDYKAIPSVVYTDPEVASVGFTEQELIRQNRDYKVGICQNRALGRAHTADKLDGFAKVLIAADSEIIVGVHLVAPHASEMIGEAVVACDRKLTARELARLSHAHPTFLEAIKEACLQAIEGRSIHIP
jgi:dihydrolipoamide dehydrogenase